MRHLVATRAVRAERRAAPKPARVPSGDRPTYPSDEGLSLTDSAWPCQATQLCGSLPRVPRCAGCAQLVADRPMFRS